MNALRRFFAWFHDATDEAGDSIRLPGLIGKMEPVESFPVRSCNRCAKRYKPIGERGLFAWLNCSDCRKAIALEAEMPARKPVKFRKTA